MRTREPMDLYDIKPEGMTAYLRYNGYHFNKKMCEFAVRQMRKFNPVTNRSEKVECLDKESVDELLNRHGVSLENCTGYDHVFVWHMGKADFLGSSITDEAHLAKYVKDVVDDIDQVDGFIFNRWYADMVRNGIPIDWEEMV